MSSQKKQSTGGKSGVHGDLTQRLFVNEHSKGTAFEKDGQRRCFGCMELYSKEYDVCPFCGYTTNIEVENALHMYPGMVLHDKYIIGKVIGYGGFGVTYLAWDTVLQTKVAIKEYLPSEFSTRAVGQTQVTVFSGDKAKQFNDGMEKFVDEAKRLAKFRNENGIVKIFDSFSENGTAYIVMEYLQGETLSQRLEREKTIPVEEAIQMLMPIIESLNRVHDEGIIHRDIAPDNIFLTNKGEVKLIDFGASRYATTSRSRSLTVIIKPGYSAEEQYRSRGDQGPHTDVYSVGACLYKMITGETPPDAMERRAQFEKNHKDMLKPIRKYVKNIDPRRENAIYNALNVRIEDRTPDMISLAGELTSEEPVKRRKSSIKKIDPLTWPLWAKIGIPSGLAAVIALCVLLAAGVIGPKSGLEYQYYVPDGQTIVPNIVGFTEKKAEKKLKKYELNYMISDRVVSDTLSMDLILLQDPDAYNVANINSYVSVTKSDGHGMGTVPDVVGILKEEAQAELEKEGFKVKFVEKGDDIIAPGYVISQSEEAGAQLEKVITEITLEVSTGREGIDTSVEVVVPNLIEKKLPDAKTTLRSLDLYIGMNFVYNEALPENEVVAQSPVKGEKVHKGDTVIVTVNRGAMTVVVKNVVERKIEAAEADLQALGLKVYTKGQESEIYDVGTVMAQSIAPGTAVKLGSEITLTVSEGKKVTVPNVVGKDKKAAIAAMQAVGLNCTFEYRESDKPKDQVLSQEPVSGQVVQMKSTVIVTLSGTGNVDDANATTLVRIAVESKPSKTEYNIDDYFDDSGMKVVAYYGSGASKDVTSACTCSQTASFSKSGTQSITMTYQEGGVTKTASVTVRVNGVSVSLSLTNTYIAVGSSSEITATVTPERATLSWSSSNEKVAKVSGGNVTAVSAGSAVITATARIGSDKATATCTVTVTEKEIKADNVILSETTLSLEEGQTSRLTATPDPVNATVKSIKWSSSNSKVATVDSNGVVTAVSEGTATIKATISGVESSHPCTVKVTAPKIESISVVDGTYPTQLYVGEHIDVSNMKIKVKYSNGKEQMISNGFTLSMTTSEKTGFYDIKVTYKGAATTVRVEFADAGVTISASTREMFVGDTISLSATTRPSGQEVSWHSSNNNVATVNAKGVVSGVSAGTVTITATIKVGGSSFKNECKITVKASKSVTGIKISNKPDKMKGYYIGDTISTSGLELKKTYSDGKTEKVTTGYSISPEKIEKAGDNTITVTYSGYTATFKVNASSPSIELSGSNTYSIVEGATKTVRIFTRSPESGGEITWKCDGNISLKKSDNESCEIMAGTQGQGTLTVTLKYNEKKYTDSIMFYVSGRTLESISVNADKAKKSYYPGDKVDTAGLVVTAKYNGSESGGTISDYTVSPEVIGMDTKQITVNYNGQTATYSISLLSLKVSLTVDESKRGEESGSMLSFGDSVKIKANVSPSDGWTYKWELEDLQPLGQESTSSECIVTCNSAMRFTGIVKLKASRNGLEPIEVTKIISVAPPPGTALEVVWVDDGDEKIYGESNPKDNLRVRYKDDTGETAFTTNFECVAYDGPDFPSKDGTYMCREYYVKLGKNVIDDSVVVKVRKVEENKESAKEEKTNED